MLDTLKVHDDNRIWKAFIHYILDHDERNAEHVPTLSGRAVFALNNALGAIGTMQQAMAQISAAETVIASAFAEIEDEFIEHIFSGSLSEDILVVSSGRKGKIRGVVFVKQSNGLYLFGTDKLSVIAGPYLSLDTSLSYARSYIRRSRSTLVSIKYAKTIPAAFIEDVVINSCPIIGTRFTLNGKLCARSDDTPYVEVEF